MSFGPVLRGLSPQYFFEFRTSTWALFTPVHQVLIKRRPRHDLPDQAPRRPVRDGVDLRGLALRVAARAVHLPFLLAGDAVEVLPEVRRDRVVGDVRALTRDFAVLDFPED